MNSVLASKVIATEGRWQWVTHAPSAHCSTPRAVPRSVRLLVSARGLCHHKHL